VKVAFGFKAHSGWAALVVLGAHEHTLEVVDRRRIELADDRGGEWARQPYHAAEGLPTAKAQAIVTRGIETAERLALQEMRAALARARTAQHDVAACGVLVGEPMPAWSVGDILAVHFRMHKAEGVLFRDALLHAAEACAISLVTIPEKTLPERAKQMLGGSFAQVASQIVSAGQAAGAPWGKDQKDAALVAAVALHTRA
jgi:hypothetical protein